MDRIVITGTAGFIGFHLAKLLLQQGYIIHGIDGLTDYYDVTLKERRHAMLLQNQKFSCSVSLLEDQPRLDGIIDEFRPNVIVHLAAQAGVRYSIDNPRPYIESNIVGTFNILEAAKRHKIKHLLMASTSSVYGASTEMPVSELQKADNQLSLYAATKKANESMAHAYSNLWEMPITMFRFFTVYGPWGRPDLALYKFVSAMLEGRPIDIYNEGNMFRDFTYVDDLVRAIQLLIDEIPGDPLRARIEFDSLSPVAPFRIVNIGNSQKIKLLDFIDAIEEILQVKAERNYMPMQMGDVAATWADTSLLHALTGYRPQTDFREGITRFVNWYREYNDA